jgi:hypothetical protein
VSRREPTTEPFQTAESRSLVGLSPPRDDNSIKLTFSAAKAASRLQKAKLNDSSTYRL